MDIYIHTSRDIEYIGICIMYSMFYYLCRLYCYSWTPTTRVGFNLMTTLHENCTFERTYISIVPWILSVLEYMLCTVCSIIPGDYICIVDTPTTIFWFHIMTTLDKNCAFEWIYIYPWRYGYIFLSSVQFSYKVVIRWKQNIVVADWTIAI